MSTTRIALEKSEIDFRVNKIIIEKLNIDDCKIPNDASFTHDLGIYSNYSPIFNIVVNARILNFV